MSSHAARGPAPAGTSCERPRPSLTDNGRSVDVSRDSVPARTSVALHGPRLLSEGQGRGSPGAQGWPRAGLPARGRRGARGHACRGAFKVPEEDGLLRDVLVLFQAVALRPPVKRLVRRRRAALSTEARGAAGSRRGRCRFVRAAGGGTSLQPWPLFLPIIPSSHRGHLCRSRFCLKHNSKA